jgi:hypothetical protein
MASGAGITEKKKIRRRFRALLGDVLASLAEMTHLTRGLDHLRTGSGPERLGPALAVDVLERLEGAFRAVGAHARLPHLERHPQGGRLHALDQRADEQIHGRHDDCVVVLAPSRI